MVGSRKSVFADPQWPFSVLLFKCMYFKNSVELVLYMNVYHQESWYVCMLFICCDSKPSSWTQIYPFP